MLNPREYCFDCMTRLPSEDGVCPSCGKDNQVRKNAAGELPFAHLAGKYLVGKALGQGGFGITYVGLNDRLGTRVAIKEYFPMGLARRAADRIHVEALPEMEELFEEGKRRALEEARMTVQVQDVPDVVRLYDCFSRNNTVYLVMEFIEGESLNGYARLHGSLKWPELWGLLRPIGIALDRLHRKDLIHRDVSPDNIMVRKDTGRAVLLDFGAASGSIQEGQDRAKILKEGFAAPEQYQTDSRIDGRADEYSFCATLWFMITGERPPGAMQRLFQEQQLVFPRGKGRDVPKNARGALVKGLEVKPEDRYPTLLSLIGDLDGGGRRNPAGQKILGIAAAVMGVLVLGLLLFGLFL